MTVATAVNTIWIPSPDSVYVLADEPDVFVTFPSSSTSRQGSDNYQTVSFYTMGKHGRLKPNTQRQLARYPGISDVNGLKVQWYGRWADLQPKKARTLDERLTACGNDFDAIWKILSVNSNRREISIHLDTQPYGKRFGLQYTYSVYVHKDAIHGYIISNVPTRHANERTRPLSELNYDDVQMITVNTPNHGCWQWKREESR